MAEEYLSRVEDKIAELLMTIVKGNVDPLGNYEYITNAGSVNIEDKRLADSIGDGVDFLIEQVPNETSYQTKWGMDAISNYVDYEITARVENAGDVENPILNIKRECNKVLSDMKHLFFVNNTLQKTVSRVWYKTSRREIDETNDRIQSAKLIFTLGVDYSQSGKNPTLSACEH